MLADLDKIVTEYGTVIDYEFVFGKFKTYKHTETLIVHGLTICETGYHSDGRISFDKSPVRISVELFLRYGL
jgi:hypothetical protein